MTTDYNHIADEYRQAKAQPWRDRIETYSMMRLIGDLAEQRVIDLACGEGFFTRKLKRGGAAWVQGLDISQEMIGLAKQEEARAPLGIEYLVEDAAAAGPDQDFDLAVSAWLLVYAHNREELRGMARGLARRLRSGGRLVTLTTNPGLYHFPRLPSYGKYGFDIRLADRAIEGAPIVWTIHLDSGSFEIENYYLPTSLLEAALVEAGFRDVAFHGLELAPCTEGRTEGDYWNDFLQYPPAVMIDAIKS